MLTWLVTGAGGFLGRHVLEALIASRLDGTRRVVALDRDRAGSDYPERLIVADLTNLDGLNQVVEKLRPDVVIHAAGRTPPADAESLYRANTLSTSNLLRVLGELGKPVRVVLVGSAAEVGPVPARELPVTEEHACRPVGAYGLSKWCATYSGLKASSPVEVVVGRIFNLVGPGLPVGQAFGRFAAKLTEAATHGDCLRMRVNHVGARRDFVDVRDASRALLALAEQGKPGTLYNIGTGQSRAIGEGLDALIRISGRKVEVEVGPLEAGGPDDSRADITRITSQTDWSPEVSWESSLCDLWKEACRRRLQESASTEKQVA